MLRIGKACSLAELKGWHDWDKQWNRHGSWIDSVSLLLDQSQPAYRNDKETAPNSIFDGVYHAFLREVRHNPSLHRSLRRSFGRMAWDLCTGVHGVYGCV